MKNIVPVVALLCISLGCSNKKEVYTELGYHGHVKKAIHKQYNHIIQKFGGWQPEDSTKENSYLILTFDSNGNKLTSELHLLMELDYMVDKSVIKYENNRKLRQDRYDSEGKITDYSLYNYSSEKACTQTTYDTAGNVTFVDKTIWDITQRQILSHEYNTYENGQPGNITLRTEEYKGDTGIITTVDKSTGKTSTSKSVVLSRDAMGNCTKNIFLDSTFKKPVSITISSYDYY
jgi:hypothetical protein